MILDEITKKDFVKRFFSQLDDERGHSMGKHMAAMTRDK